jgi:hypothetical protein
MTPSLSMNAFDDKPAAASRLAETWIDWVVNEHTVRTLPVLSAPREVDLQNWKDPKIGWGVLLPENESLGKPDRALALDAPSPLQKLIRQRSGVVLRYREDLFPERIRRYFQDGEAKDLALTGSGRGIGREELPYYLLIYATPDVIPWSVQYTLSSSCFTGRLFLDDASLERYVGHLLTDWDSCTAVVPSGPVVWSVDFGAPDITSLMRKVIAEPLCRAYQLDKELQPICLFGASATHEELQKILAKRHPKMIVTTSHGRTSPIDATKVDELRGSLGLPVDAKHSTLKVKGLLEAWQPDGAVWYAHACCSAGADRDTNFQGLFESGSANDSMLKGVAGAGSLIAPLPMALLTAEKPARAFIGHVEPTFDWTLQDPETGQSLTSELYGALYTRLFNEVRSPVGHAFSSLQRDAANLLVKWVSACKGISSAKSADERAEKRWMALRLQLGGLDRQGCVIIGDPTVTIPIFTQPRPKST